MSDKSLHFAPSEKLLDRVSIIVLNYNYARFLPAAIDSALAQTWEACEVVVVDNGSTDDSAAVLARYGERIRTVRQPVNIGQGQGYNLGFEAASGDWIIWLDADDLLDHDAIAVCMAQVRGDTAKLQFPLRVIDENARPLGSAVPFLRHDGDVVPIIRRFGHYAGPPGSGNLYRMQAIQRCFPVPVAEWPICTDTVPFLAAPFFGLVVDAGRPLGSYRLHGKAGQVPGYTGNFSTSMAREAQLNAQARDRALALLHERCGIQVAGPFFVMPSHVRNRIVSWRLAQTEHLFPEDSAASLRRMMGDALAAGAGYGWRERLMLMAWALGVLHLPLPIARRLAAVTRATAAGGTMFRWLGGAAAASATQAAPLQAPPAAPLQAPPAASTPAASTPAASAPAATPPAHAPARASARASARSSERAAGRTSARPSARPCAIKPAAPASFAPDAGADEPGPVSTR